MGEIGIGALQCNIARSRSVMEIALRTGMHARYIGQVLYKMVILQGMFADCGPPCNGSMLIIHLHIASLKFCIDAKHQGNPDVAATMRTYPCQQS